MSKNFKKMTRVMSWFMTLAIAMAFALPVNAIEFFSTPLRYQWISQSGTLSADGTAHEYNVQAGDTVSMSLTIQNRSVDAAAKVMYGVPPGGTLLPEVAPYRGAHELRIGVKNDEILSWIDSSSFYENPDGDNNRFAVYDGVDANYGENLTFTWDLKIADSATDGVYDLYTGLVREFDAWARQVNASGALLGSGDIFWRFNIGDTAYVPPVQTGALTVNALSTTPPPDLVPKGGNANFTKFSLTAATGTTVKITKLWVTRDGLSTDDEVENVKILDADLIQHGGTAGGFNSNHKAQIYFSPALEITGTMDFYIRAGFDSTNGDVTHTARLGVADNADIVSDATSVAGAPVWGNYMTVIDVTIGSLTLKEDGSITDSTPDVGDTDVIVNAFKLVNDSSTENIVVEQITVNKAGSAEANDTVNIELWDVTNNVSIGEVANWNASSKAVFPVNITINKGKTIRYRIQLDIVDGSSLTVNADLVDGSDVLIFAKGLSYGYYITPACVSTGGADWSLDSGTGGTNNKGQGDKSQTINAGTITISKSASTPATGNIAVASDVKLATFDFDIRGEEMQFTAVDIDFKLSDAGGSTAITYADLTNAVLLDAAGNILAGPVDGEAVVSDNGAYDEGTFDFNDTFTLSPGVQEVSVTTDLGTDFEASDTIQVTIAVAADVTAKGLQTGNSVVPTVTGATGNEQTIKAGAVVMRTLASPPSGNVIKGATDLTWATFSLDASASGEDVLVSSITVGDDVGASANMANLDNAELWADLDSDGSFETKISKTEQPDGAVGVDDTHAFTLTESIRIAKGSFIKFIFMADLATAADADATSTHAFTLDANTVAGVCITATGADTGSDITETDDNASGGILTVAAVGSVSLALDGSTPSKSIMLSNTSGNVLAKYKLTALDEAFIVDKVTLLLADWGTSLSQWDSISKLTIEYPKEDGTTGIKHVSPSTTSALFDNIAMYIPKNDSAILTVKADFFEIATQSADFGDQIKISFDADSTGFNSVGQDSGTADTDCGDDTLAKTHVLYKTLVTVTADNAGLSSVLVPGSTTTLYQFKVTADSAGPAALKRLTFQVNLADNGTTASTVDLGGFLISRDGSDLTASDALIAGVSGTTDNTSDVARATMEGKGTNDIESDADGQVTTWVNVMFGNTPTADNEETIAAGDTTVWKFRGTFGAGFSASDDDSVTVELLGDTTLPTDGAYYLFDNDATAAEDAICLQDEAGVSDVTDTEFIWSDISGYDYTSNFMIHSASYSNNSADETSSGDWANGAYIKNFPLGTHSLIA